jgi:hypothetical protein
VTTRDERYRHNQARFRTANERLDQIVKDRIADDALIPFLCECPDEECTARTELTAAEYRTVRANANWFLLKPGHAVLPSERIMEENGRYTVAEKDDG